MKIVKTGSQSRGVLTSKRYCANPKCKKFLPADAHGGRKFCNTKCSSAANYAKKAAEPQEPKEEVWTCFGCSHPKERQAEPVGRDVRRHPVKGERPEHSGYCASPQCECRTCRPEGPQAEPKPLSLEPEALGSCPLPRLSESLSGLHRRAVAEGRMSCSCKTEVAA